MNVIWIVLISVSIVVAACTNRLEALTRAMFDGAKAAVEVSLFLLGIVALWLGITRILEDSGLIYRIAHVFKPVITRLFRRVPDDHPAITSITLNMLANLFGLGNAATPLGIKAMQDLQTLNNDKDSVTAEMMLFVVLNTASVQLIPFTVVGILSDYGSKSPSGIVLPTICSTAVSALVALGVLWVFRRLKR